jgi:hypothetical protein
MNNEITFDEFFSLRRLLNGSEEDCELGISNLKNLNYHDKYIIHILFIKSLSLNNRRRFIRSTDIELDITFQTLIGEQIYNTIIYNTITETCNKKVYKQILFRIMTN